MVMGHTLDALRSRNSASLGPGASMRSAKRLDAGSCALKKQPNVSGSLGWFVGVAIVLAKHNNVHRSNE